MALSCAQLIDGWSIGSLRGLALDAGKWRIHFWRKSQEYYACPSCKSRDIIWSILGFSALELLNSLGLLGAVSTPSGSLSAIRAF
jgi:hypothetical protein